DGDAPESNRGFLLNHIISERLPLREGGHRYSNSDPVTGQAAWYDLRVRLERCAPEECGVTDPLLEPVQARPRRRLDDGRHLRYGKDLKCRQPAGDRPGASAAEWIGNRHEVSLTVGGVADGKGNVRTPAADEHPGKDPGEERGA